MVQIAYFKDLARNGACHAACAYLNIPSDRALFSVFLNRLLYSVTSPEILGGARRTLGATFA
jgi:hypothetical protein